MAFTPAGNWRPRGIENLEPRAWDALRHQDGACVIAGPGAGKSEFLAQKAVFLLETGLCPPPQRILAISFKSDAADNLAQRVKKRCPSHLATRFSSMTFDAFAKNLVDRFHSAIPPLWRPSKPYDVHLTKKAEVVSFLRHTSQDAPQDFRNTVAQIPESIFEPKYVGSHPLNLRNSEPETGIAFAVDQWWERRLNRAGRSSLSFVCLNRLAELIIRTNPPILRALRATYPFVFVDEFQDTTFAQYSFLKTLFSTEKTAVTAVGDEKQRIMTWAGARPDSFEIFSRHFRATRFPLVFNFRSSPELVRIQHIVAQSLNPHTPAAESRSTCKVKGDVCQVWVSPNKRVEVHHTANWIRNDMDTRGMEPRDYVILVKQLPDNYASELESSFAAVDLRIRNESHEIGRTLLQDLLVDDLSRNSLALLRLGLGGRSPECWQLLTSTLPTLRACDSEDEGVARKIESELSAFIKTLRTVLAQQPPSEQSAASMASIVHEFLDLQAFRRSFRSYGTGELLSIMAEAFTFHLKASAADATSWEACLDAFEGTSRIPMMTVHKSKGLEYDTVVFIGLDDEAWWSHTTGSAEGQSAFFVALSRAKQRAIFAFCQKRGLRRKVSDLYQLLADAGVPEILIEDD
jgi:superfamily I DNA/RNA helicase